MDALGGALSPKIKGLLRGEGLSEDHHGIHVGVLHRLEWEHKNIPLFHFEFFGECREAKKEFKTLDLCLYCKRSHLRLETTEKL